VHSILYNRIKSNIVYGVNPVLGPGNSVMELMRDEFLLEHSLFSRRLAFFRFKQGKGQSMSDAVNDLQRLGDQSDLAGLGPEDLYIMRYLTITDDPELLDKLLYRVALRIVRRCRRLSNAKRGDNFRDKVTQKLGTSVAVYLVTDSETGKISVISLSTTTCALALRQGKASNHLVKQSETVSMYSLPFFDLGKGPTKYMLIFWKG
jgi:hypothetical protein